MVGAVLRSQVSGDSNASSPLSDPDPASVLSGALSPSSTSASRGIGSEANVSATCPDCGKVFTRLEHMKRHRVSHTQEPDHTCAKCSKSFYRLDALKRHELIHFPRPPTAAQLRSASGDGERKVRQACKRCSRMKLKCDGLSPCLRCRRAKLNDQCQYRSTATMAAGPGSQPTPVDTNSAKRQRTGAGAQTRGSISRMAASPSSAAGPSRRAPRCADADGLLDSVDLVDSESLSQMQEAVDRHAGPQSWSISNSTPQRVNSVNTNALPSQRPRVNFSDDPSSSNDHSHVLVTSNYTLDDADETYSEISRTESDTTLSRDLMYGLDSNFSQRRGSSHAYPHDFDDAQRSMHDNLGTNADSNIDPSLEQQDAGTTTATGTTAALPLSLSQSHASALPSVEQHATRLTMSSSAPGTSAMPSLDVSESVHRLSDMQARPCLPPIEDSAIVDLFDSSRIFELNVVEAPSTDLDWLFSAFSPFDQVLNPLLSAGEGLIGSTNAGVVTPHPVQGCDRASSPLRMLSEAAAFTSNAPETDSITAHSLVVGGAHDSTTGTLAHGSAASTQTATAGRQGESSGPGTARDTFAVGMNLASGGGTCHDRRSSSPSRQHQHPPPRDVLAPSRRPSMSNGPDKSLKRSWPTSYHPSIVQAQTSLISFEPISTAIALAEDTCQVPAFDARCREMVASMALTLPPGDQTPVYNLLSQIDIRSYNVMLQLYFEHFHAYYPFLHKPTFEPSKCSPCLLMGLCAIGCSYSRMQQSSVLSDWMIDIVHRSVRHMTDQNMLHARSLPIIQALFLCSIGFSSSGNRRLFEHGEALRSALATMVRRCNLLERKQRPQHEESVHADVQAQWLDWIQYESANRTAWTCFVADLELAVCWKFSATYNLDELRAELPCRESIFEAASASTWAAHKLPNPMFLPERLEHVRAGQSLADCSGFEQKVVAMSLSTMGLSLSHLVNPVVQLTLGPALDQFDALLTSAASVAARTPSIASATLEVLVRFNHLSTLVRLVNLQALGGRRGRTEAGLALQELCWDFEQNPAKAATCAMLCGRIVGLVRSWPLITTCDSNMLFYSALCLFALSHHFGQVAQRAKTNTGTVSTPSLRVCLDADEAVGPDSIQLGSASLLLRSIGNMAAPAAPRRILTTYSEMLLNDLRPHRHSIARPLGRLLAQMAESEPLTA
ncbi:hypothetical protein BCV70DRAFT_202877 [Testicularia cyperi]|uniref:Zn(2)-C6 fungal-type domain-containing protein n=1 Tax=Testicularia cyperi TaxID=1882483 RepID=A0A317XIM4_9BASI|nr:hypothetical protein BCV70DRAFT_202877 [Testicularia cyperi]